jgi:ferric-dicitrate binding protein FerR (iron transport regulator)
MSGPGDDPLQPAAAPQDDDADVARVLRLAAAPMPSPSRRAAAFERVHAEWRAALTDAASAPAGGARPAGDPAEIVPRATRRAAWRNALAAGVAAAALGVVLWATGATARPATLAIAQAVSGPQATLLGSSPLDRLFGRGRGLAADAAIRAGDAVATGEGTAALLQVGPGLALRLAPGSRLRFDTAEQVTLLSGQVYVEADTGAGTPAPLTVATAYARVRHVGTRYLVRVLPATLDVAVREGRVQLSRAATAPVEAGAGERLRLDGATGTIARERVAPSGEAWGWLGRIPAPVSIDGATLGRFLEWYTAESGRRVEFGAAAMRERAAAIRLRGSVAGLTPDEALDSVAASADLRVERGADRVTIDAAGS